MQDINYPHRIPSRFSFPYLSASIDAPPPKAALKAKSSVRTLHTFEFGTMLPCLSNTSKMIEKSEFSDKEIHPRRELKVRVLKSNI